MRITVPFTEYKEVQLDKRSINTVFRKRLFELLDWHEDYKIKDGKVYKEVEYYTSHKFDVDEEVRVATDQDYENERIVKMLLSKLYKET